jgi:cell division protein FtsI/penicillin-binding protein 2
MSQGCALLMDAKSRRVLYSEGDPGIAAAPGSTLKPLVLAALMEAGKLRDEETFLCPVELRIAGRSFDCSHPRLAAPMTVAPAIAYSCNGFVAHVARRFGEGELARRLAHLGLPAARISPAATAEGQQLQALGRRNVTVTPNDLLLAYHALAGRAPRAILEGLEGAVEYGTGQRAAVPGVRVAGKTGTASGNAVWFAGFAPSRSPRVIAVVLTGGRSGGGDAAPIAGKLLAKYL